MYINYYQSNKLEIVQNPCHRCLKKVLDTSIYIVISLCMETSKVAFTSGEITQRDYILQQAIFAFLSFLPIIRGHEFAEFICYRLAIIFKIAHIVTQVEPTPAGGLKTFYPSLYLLFSIVRYP